MSAFPISVPYPPPCRGDRRHSALRFGAIIGAHALALALVLVLKAAPLTLPASPLTVEITPPEALAVRALAPRALPTPAVVKPLVPAKAQQRTRQALQPTSSPVVAARAESAAAPSPGEATQSASAHENESSPMADLRARATTGSDVVTQPRFAADYLLNPAPAYPALARRMGEEGNVTLRVFVETNGRASQVEIKSGSGSPRLDQAAQDAVSRWKFVPARRGDETVAAWVLVPIVFKLRN